MSSSSAHPQHRPSEDVDTPDSNPTQLPVEPDDGGAAPVVPPEGDGDERPIPL